MTVETFRDYCLQKPGATLDFPFDNVTAVFKVAGKMFALVGINDSPAEVNLKCDPGLARDLRERFADVKPGYHMNKDHWNTVVTGDDVPDEKFLEMVDLSYDLVVAKLPKKKQAELGFTRA